MPNIASIDQNTTTRCVVKTREKAGQCSLAGAGSTDQRNSIASGHVQADIFEYRAGRGSAVCIVAERYVLELHRADSYRKGLAQRMVINLWLDVEECENS